MIVVRDFDRLKGKELVATIGFFDGVHLGHRFLIDELGNHHLGGYKYQPTR